MDKSMRKVDRSNAYGVIEVYPNQIEQAMKVAKHAKIDIPEGGFDHILVAGVGGSALAAEILVDYLPQTNIRISKDYAIPPWVTKNTLVIVSSYSGTTEETIAAYKAAARKQATIVAIASGGDLQDLAESHRNLFLPLPVGMQPRDCTLFMCTILLKLLHNSGLVKDACDIDKELEESIAALHNTLYRDIAKDLSQKLVGKIPLIYATPSMRSIAYRWKIGFNENSKVHAFTNVIPELDHNEIVGFTHLQGNYFVIFLTDQDDPNYHRKRVEVTKEQVKSKGVNTIEFHVKGKTRLSRMLSGLIIGVWTSYFLALAYNIDPTPVVMVEELKKRLKTP
ncbi:bifunctional phosphoglucose/phosphomannose isomerase [Candidatus Woesearchaeota archaeon]|nr:bifunctional phosphoglucose/phosphomannose isomerase [Candidatus Woesearchaeota archaeon]